MKKIFILILLTFNFNSYAIMANKMFVVIGAVKY